MDRVEWEVGPVNPENDSDICHKNGWKVGDHLIGNEGYGDTEIVITAIGKENVLAQMISHNGKPVTRMENMWSLRFREWRKPEGGTDA